VARGDALRLVARVMLLAAWSILVWGHLVLAATLVDAATEGVRVAWERLLPAREITFWGWLNAFSAVLAPASWAVLGVQLWLARSPRPTLDKRSE
jgi:hypothetical protein